MPFSDFFSAMLTTDPSVRFLQAGVLLIAVFLLFLLLYTLRDILLRTHSFWYQAFSVLIVGALPIVGFLVYLLIRPARTIREREVEDMLRILFPTEEAQEAEEGEEGDEGTEERNEAPQPTEDQQSLPIL